MSVNKYNSTTGNLERLDGYTVDSTPTSGSGNPVSSGGVFTALAGKLDKTGGTVSGDLTVSGNFTMGTDELKMVNSTCGISYTMPSGVFNIEGALDNILNRVDVGSFMGQFFMSNIAYAVVGVKVDTDNGNMMVTNNEGDFYFAYKKNGTVSVKAVQFRS